MFKIGDIVEIFSPLAGHKKYHVCIKEASETEAAQFLFLNSDPNFEGVYAVDCSRVSCIPPSDTGKTAFSFAMLPRYNDHQLKIYRAQKLGELDSELAKELSTFAEGVNTMNRPDRTSVLAALKIVIEKNA